MNQSPADVTARHTAYSQILNLFSNDLALKGQNLTKDAQNAISDCDPVTKEEQESGDHISPEYKQLLKVDVYEQEFDKLFDEAYSDWGSDEDIYPHRRRPPWCEMRNPPLDTGYYSDDDGLSEDIKNHRNYHWLEKKILEKNHPKKSITLKLKEAYKKSQIHVGDLIVRSGDLDWLIRADKEIKIKYTPKGASFPAMVYFNTHKSNFKLMQAIHNVCNSRRVKEMFEYGYPLPNDSCAYAVRQGNVEYLDCLLKLDPNGIKTSRENLSDSTAFYGHVNVMEYLKDSHNILPTIQGVKFALSRKHYPVIYWMNEKELLDKSKMIALVMEEEESWPLLAWLLEIGCPWPPAYKGIEDSVVDAHSGSLEMLNFLHENGYEINFDMVYRRAVNFGKKEIAAWAKSMKPDVINSRTDKWWAGDITKKLNDRD